jgi:signal transduction histidine kinase
MSEAEERVNILIVDDTPANLVALEAVLSDLQQDIVKAQSGRQALKQLLRQDFAVILLDVKMPEMDGFETAALIRQRPRSEHTPIIFVTAHDASDTSLSRGYSLGAVDYIYSPVVPEILRAKVASFVELSKIQLLHQRAELRARQEATRAQALARIATRLISELDVQNVLRMVCEETAQVLAVPAVLASLYDEKRQAFCLTSQLGLPRPLRQQLQQLPLSSCQCLIKSNEQVGVIADTQAVPDLAQADLYARFNIRTVVSALMVHDGRTLGCLILFSFDEVRAFSDDDLDFLRGLVDQTTLAITNTRLFGEVQRKQQQLRQLTQKLVTVQEEERQYIARELHDQAGQVMIALQIILGLIKQELPAEMATLHEELAEAIALTKKMTGDVRTLAHTLRPPLLDEGRLDVILQGLCQDIARYTHLNIQYEGVEVPPLMESAPLSLYRFVQEALTNVAKHAQAQEIRVTLSCQPDGVVLTVVDDGIGFNPQEKLGAGGMGLVGMQQRLEMLGGRLEIESEPGRGSRLTASAPYASGGK